MICCNIDDSELLDDEKLSMYVKKSETVEINGVQIGFIGYVSKEDLVSTKAFKFVITVKL
jgi:2',3'-cyclic-nucleotide 2'-phosphodiesterase (5'-nucleotidase family)